MTTDPTITIAGLEARIGVLSEALHIANRGRADLSTDASKLDARLGAMEAERDALAAQLAEARAKLDAAPKVCAIHSYALEGPCMTCGAPWPGAEKALRQERVEGMEKMLRISRAVGCPNSVEEVVEAVAAIKADLASERAHLAACRTRIAGLEQAANERAKEDKDRGTRMDAIRAALGAHPFASDDHIADRIRALTARVAEFEARPVLTVERLTEALVACRNLAPIGCTPGAADHASAILAKLGPVTLPAQDRAEELANVYVDEWNGRSDCRGDAQAIAKRTAAMRRALASLGAPPTSPTAARPVFAGVSVDELARVSADEYDGSGDQIGDADRAAIRAVLARLGVALVAPVDPEVVARAYHDHPKAATPEWDEIEIWAGDDNGQDATVAAMRATLTAAGVPVTPERGK